MTSSANMIKAPCFKPHLKLNAYRITEHETCLLAAILNSQTVKAHHMTKEVTTRPSRSSSANITWRSIDDGQHSPINSTPDNICDSMGALIIVKDERDHDVPEGSQTKRLCPAHEPTRHVGRYRLEPVTPAFSAARI